MVYFSVFISRQGKGMVPGCRKELSKGACMGRDAIHFIMDKVEDKEVKKFTDLTNVIYEHKKGDKLKLTVSYPSGKEYKEKQIEDKL